MRRIEERDRERFSQPPNELNPNQKAQEGTKQNLMSRRFTLICQMKISSFKSGVHQR